MLSRNFVIRRSLPGFSRSRSSGIRHLVLRRRDVGDRRDRARGLRRFTPLSRALVMSTRSSMSESMDLLAQFAAAGLAAVAGCAADFLAHA